MGKFTDRLTRRKTGQDATRIVRDGNSVHWDATIREDSELRQALIPWAEHVCESVLPEQYSHLVAKVAWSSRRQINWTKTAEEIVRDLAGTELLAGGHDPTLRQGRVITGTAITVGDVEYAVLACGVYPRGAFSEAIDLLAQVHLSPDEVEVRLDTTEMGPIEAIFDDRDVDRAEVASCFAGGDVPVTLVSATHNAHDSVVDQVVRVIVPWGSFILLAWGTPYGKRLQEKIAEAHAQSVIRWGGEFLKAIAGLARKMGSWRKPLVVIETLIADCVLMFRFKRIKSDDVVREMIADLQRAVGEAVVFIQHYRDKGEAFRAVAYEFSIVERKWILLTVHKANGIILSSAAGASLAALIHQDSSVGIRE